MAHTFDLTVPTPCEKGKNEWNQSVKTEKGIFCRHCSTEVIDFSYKTPQEIKAFFKNYTGQVCGKFYADQLTAYKIVEYKPVMLKRFVLSGLLSLLFTAKNHAETANPTQQVTYSPEITRKQLPEPGKFVADSVEIIGRVLPENETYGIFNVKVGMKGTNTAVLTDSSGRFILKVSKEELSRHDTLLIEASFYEEYTRTVKLESKDVMSYNLGDIFLKSTIKTPEIVVGTVQPQPYKKQKGFLKRLFGKKD